MLGLWIFWWWQLATPVKALPVEGKKRDTLSNKGLEIWTAPLNICRIEFISIKCMYNRNEVHSCMQKCRQLILACASIRKDTAAVETFRALTLGGCRCLSTTKAAGIRIRSILRWIVPSAGTGFSIWMLHKTLQDPLNRRHGHLHDSETTWPGQYHHYRMLLNGLMNAPRTPSQNWFF